MYSLDLSVLRDQFYFSLQTFPLPACLVDVFLTSSGDRLRVLTLNKVKVDILLTSLVCFRHTTLISMESNFGRMVEVACVR